jgi:hypothetical protein
VLRYLAGLAACVMAAASPLIVQAQQNRSSPPVRGASDPAQAKALLMQMADYLARAQAFSVTVDASYDVVQDSGQKIEFGEIRHVLLRRPDDLRIDLEERDGAKEQVFFDGQKLTLFSPGENIYASLKRPGSVDDTIDYFVYALQTRIPLSVLLETSLPRTLEQGVTTISAVGDETLAGRAVEHLAARAKNVDFQVWIATGAKPVPLRVLITYKFAPGQPQFSASLSDWNFHPNIEPSEFAFVPPAGAESVTFMVPASSTPVRAGSGGQ